MLLVYIIPAIVILLILFLALGYLKAPPDTAFIISGLGKKRILIGKAGWRFPFLERVDIERWLGAWIEQVGAGGESGEGARVCDYRWVADLREQCVRRGVSFHFHQTGARYLRDGVIRDVPRYEQSRLARQEGLEYRARPDA